jgi:pimeloyl-ACP methyl ester carboxylesterase
MSLELEERMASSRTSFAAIAGIRIEVLELQADTTAAPPLVLLHEGLGSVDLWRGFPQALHEATGARTLVFSRFGHGRSDPPPRPRTPTFMHEEALEVLPAVLEKFSIERPILVGHSDGASIALIYASEYPVSGLILFAPHVFVEEMGVRSIEQTHHAFHNEGLRERMARYHDDPEITFSGWSGVWLDPEFRSWNIEPLLPRVTAPLLLVQGTDDQYGTLAQLETIERGVSGTTERLIVSGGHAPHREHPELVVDACRRFVEAISRGGPRVAVRH